MSDPYRLVLDLADEIALKKNRKYIVLPKYIVKT